MRKPVNRVPDSKQNPLWAFAAGAIISDEKLEKIDETLKNIEELQKGNEELRILVRDLEQTRDLLKRFISLYNLALADFDQGNISDAVKKLQELVKRGGLDLSSIEEDRLRQLKNFVEYGIGKCLGITILPSGAVPPDYNLPVPFAELKKTIAKSGAAILRHALSPERKPFRMLTSRQVEGVIRQGEQCRWDERRKNGWPYHTNAFTYVYSIYGKWIPGLTRENLAAADRSLYLHIIRKISLEGEPWFDFPTGAEARLRAITDPQRRAEIEVVRSHERARIANARKLAPK